MLRSKAVWVLGLAVLVCAVFIGQALSQETAPGGGRGGRGARGNNDPNQARDRMEQFRQQAADRMKEALGVTDEQWKALQPKIEKVQTLARETRGGGMMMGRMMGGRGGAGAQPPAANTDRPQSDVEKKMADLQKLLQDKESKAEDIKTALAAYRDAVTKAKTELEKARKELRELLSVRQEAQLVLVGVLE